MKLLLKNNDHLIHQPRRGNIIPHLRDFITGIFMTYSIFILQGLTGTAKLTAMVCNLHHLVQPQANHSNSLFLISKLVKLT